MIKFLLLSVILCISHPLLGSEQPFSDYKDLSPAAQHALKPLFERLKIKPDESLPHTSTWAPANSAEEEIWDDTRKIEMFIACSKGRMCYSDVVPEVKKLAELKLAAEKHSPPPAQTVSATVGADAAKTVPLAASTNSK